MTRVVVAAESAIVRAGLEAMVASSAALTLAASLPRGDLKLSGPAMTGAGVLVVELSRADDAVIADLATLSADDSGIATVLLVESPNASWVIDALRAGARAVLPRTSTAEEIIAAIEAAAAGLVVLHPSNSEEMLSTLSSTPAIRQPDSADDDPQEPLTPREIEVLAMIAEGHGNKTIAYRLGISEHTVKFHVQSIFGKLGASSRTEAVTLAIRRGLLMV